MLSYPTILTMENSIKQNLIEIYRNACKKIPNKICVHLIHRSYFKFIKVRNKANIKKIHTIKYHTGSKTPNGKVTKRQENLTYKKAKNLALSQQVTTILLGTDKTDKRSNVLIVSVRKQQSTFNYFIVLKPPLVSKLNTLAY